MLWAPGPRQRDHKNRRIPVDAESELFCCLLLLLLPLIEDARSDNADSSPRAPALAMRAGAMRAAVWLYVVLGEDVAAVEDESSREASSDEAIV